MLSIHENQSLGEAGRELLEYILDPGHWVSLDNLSGPQQRPGQNADYQRKVGPLRICASVDVTRELGVFLRIGFRAPNLTPVRAADHLEEFLKASLPLRPNTEWQVQVDARKWVHFIRRLVGPALNA
jgi:hypothetical protein